MQPASFPRRAIPQLAHIAGVTPALLAWERKWHFPSIRAVIYHSVPQSQAKNFEQQLEYYAHHYSNVTLDDLDSLVNGGVWKHSKPGIIVSFDDGLRTHAEVAAPLLEKHGLTGWFFAPTLFLDEPEQSQREFAHEHQILLHEDLPGDRVAMSWEQARELARSHVVGGHTASHVRLTNKLTDEELEEEIVESKSRLAEKLDYPVESFAWVGGEEWSYSRSAAEKIQEAGFRFSFMTNSARLQPTSSPLQLDRCRVEPNWSLAMVRWQLSGIMDWRFRAKRNRVHQITEVGNPS